MRKLNIIIGAIISLTILSCTSDDNNKALETDIIIGLWKPTKYVENYKDNTTIESEYNACSQTTRYNFSNNGNLSIQQFSENETTSICEQIIEPVQISGSWKKMTNGKYEIKSAYKYTETQQVVYTNNNFPDLIVFENNNNTMKIVFYSNSNITLDPNLKEFYTEFERLE